MIWEFHARPSQHKRNLYVCTLLLLAGCGSPILERKSDKVPSSGSVTAQDSQGVRPWGSDRTTEAQLEAWLDRERTGADPYWVCEAYIRLAELAEARLPDAAGENRQLLARAWGRALEHAQSKSQEVRITISLGQVWAGSAPTVEIIPRWKWAAKEAVPARMDRASGRWRYITVHHSAMEPWSKASTIYEDSRQELQRIQSAHMDNRDFGDLGYHFLVDPAGRIFRGRSLVWQGAHAYGANNIDNIGVCLLGNFEREQPTSAALASMHALIAHLRAEHAARFLKVRGHRDWKDTDCPGRHLSRHLVRYRDGGP